MILFGSFIGGFASAVGATAATMAIGVFIGQAGPAMAGAEEQTIRRHAALGGAIGLCFALSVMFLSAIL